MKKSCWLRHNWPEVWTKYGERVPIDFDSLWFEVFEKICLKCGARKTLNGPLRYPKDIGGGITGY